MYTQRCGSVSLSTLTHTHTPRHGRKNKIISTFTNLTVQSEHKKNAFRSLPIQFDKISSFAFRLPFLHVCACNVIIFSTHLTKLVSLHAETWTWIQIIEFGGVSRVRFHKLWELFWPCTLRKKYVYMTYEVVSRKCNLRKSASNISCTSVSHTWIVYCLVPIQQTAIHNSTHIEVHASKNNDN